MSAPNVVPFPRPTGLLRKRQAARDRVSELETLRVVDRAADVLDRLEERASTISKRIAQLQRTKKLAEERAERIEERILAEMSDRGLKEVHGLRRGFIAKANPAKLVVENESLIPREYIRVKTIREPMKDAIKAALAQGDDIAGVHLVQGVSLQRKEA